MKKIITALFAYLFLITFSLHSQTPVFIDHNVNVVTGEFCESTTDHLSSGAYPLQLTRSYNSNGNEGWRFNHPNILSRHESDPTQKEELGHALISYEYDAELQLQLIKTTNKEGSYVYNWMRFKHSNTPDNSKSYCNVESYNGKNYLYEFSKNQKGRVDNGLLLEKVILPNGAEIKYSYCPHPTERKKLISKKEESGKRFLINEYYEGGHNNVGGAIVTLVDRVRDFRIGRVRVQKAPLGTDDKPQIAARFFYDETSTHVHDALNHKKTYHHKNGLVTCIESFEDDHSVPTRRERFFWNKERKLTTRTMEDSNGVILHCKTYSYDENKNVVEEALYGNISGINQSPIFIDESGTPLDNGIDKYEIKYTYSEQQQLIAKTESNGLTTRFLYHTETGLPIGKFIGDGEHTLFRQFFEYNDDGLLVSSFIDDGHTDNPTDISGVTERRFIKYTLGTTKGICGLPVCTEEGYVDVSSLNEVVLKKTVSGYSTLGELTHQEIINQEGSQWSSACFEYDVNGRCIYAVDADGTTVHSTYDIHGNLISKRMVAKDKIVESSYTYDFSNRLIRSEDISSDKDIPSIQLLRYNLAGHKVGSYDEFGNETNYEYDGLGRLIKTILPTVLDEEGREISPTSHLKYDCCDRLCEAIDPKGYKTKTTFTVRDQPITIEYPDGTQENFEYNLDGSLKKHQSKNGIVTFYTRDLLGRTIKTETQLGIETQSYNTFHPLCAVNKNGFASYFEYDGAGRTCAVQQETTEGFATISFSYDAYNQVEKTKKWFGNAENLFTVYGNKKDSLGIVQESYIQDSSGKDLIKLAAEQKKPEIKTCYCVATNQLGQRVLQTKTTDESGKTTIITFDALKRPETVIKTTSFGDIISQTDYRYDACNNKCREVHSDPHTSQTFIISWSYGPSNRTESISEASGTPLQQTTYYTYNSKGLLEKIGKPDDVSLSYIYDDMGRVQFLSSSDHSIHYEYAYDINGNITCLTDHVSGNKIERTYTSRNQLATEKLGESILVSRTYDLLGRPILLELPDHSAISYTYDAHFLRNIDRISSDHEILYSLYNTEYDLNGFLVASELMGDLGTKQIKYDDENHCKAIQTKYWSENIVDANNKLLSKINYSDSVGNYSQNFTYDNQNRVASESGLEAQSYAYDAFHNRSSSNGNLTITNEMNQLVSTGNTEYTYDANGNLIEVKEGMKKTTYKYDALNRLIAVSNNEIHAVYTYDGLHRRLSKKILSGNNQEETFYLFDGEKEIGAMNSDLDIIQLRALDPTYVSEIGATLAVELDGVTYAAISDHNGSICCLVNHETQAVTECYRYTAFGEEKIFDGSDGSEKDAAINPWRYSSKRFDDETGFVFFGRRYYMPEAGRWTTKDPLGNLDGLNRYAYVQNNPVSNIDHFGLATWESYFNSFLAGFHLTLSGVNNVLGQIHQHLSYSSYAQNDMDFVLENTVGKGFLQFSGYYINPMETGVYGCGELNDKIRITLLNGIGCIRSDFVKSVSLFSQTHGHENIHYIFRPTRGWSHDMIMAFFIKCGYVSPHAKNLAATWKSLIKEMGGTDNGGMIIHYAHSIGGADTYVASTLLTPEEKKMIRVITIGSATMIPSEGFESVVNYVSKRDGIPMLDPIRYFTGVFTDNSNICFHGSFFGVPFIDHGILSDTYGHVIHAMGQQFLAMIPLS